MCEVTKHVIEKTIVKQKQKGLRQNRPNSHKANTKQTRSKHKAQLKRDRKHLKPKWQQNKRKQHTIKT